jgi:outer membrane protein assembly factor BamD (BamD/ComL family)
LPDYPAAIDAYEKLLARYPATKSGEETLFNLYYCYKKLGDEHNATRILNLLKEKYPNGKFTIMASNPNAAIFAAKAPKIEATRNYEDIYTSFIEGRFAEALAEKKAADSVYGKKYWTPQLLYIEAVYYIKERQDSAAKSELNNIIKDFAGTPMAARAKNLLEVLGRRKQIEDYLTNLKIERAKDDSVLVVDNEPVVVKPKADTTQSVVKKQAEDTSQVARARIRSNPLAVAGQQKQPDSAQSVFQRIQLDASHALKIKTDSTQLIRMRNQVDSIQSAMKKAAADSTKLARLKQQSDSIQLAMQKIKDDSTQLANRLPKIKSVFAYSPDQVHSVVILVNKVDPVYVTEARNAFNRYNRESYNNKPLEINNMSLNDTARMVVISGFENSAIALDYMEKARKQAPRDIIPWLPATKYSFLIITNDNLVLLMSNKDIIAYQKFLSAYYPGKF